MPNILGTDNGNITGGISDNDTIRTIESEVKKQSDIEDFLNYIVTLSDADFCKTCSKEDKEKIVEIFNNRAEEFKTLNKIGNTENIIESIGKLKDCFKKIGLNHSDFCKKLGENTTLKKVLLNHLIDYQEVRDYALDNKDSTSIFDILGMNEQDMITMKIYFYTKSNYDQYFKEVLALKPAVDKSVGYLKSASNEIHATRERFASADIEYRGIIKKYSEIKPVYDKTEAEFEKTSKEFMEIKEKYNNIKKIYTDVKIEFEKIKEKYDDAEDEEERKRIRTEFEKIKEKYDDVEDELEEIKVPYKESKGIFQQIFDKYKIEKEEYNKIKKERNEKKENYNKIDKEYDNTEKKYQNIYKQVEKHLENYNRECLNLKDNTPKILSASEKFKKFLNSRGITKKDTEINDFIEKIKKFKEYSEKLSLYRLDISEFEPL